MSYILRGSSIYCEYYICWNSVEGEYVTFGEGVCRMHSATLKKQK